MYTYHGFIQKPLSHFLFAAGRLLASSATFAAPFFFSTGDPNGKIATASRPDSSFDLRSSQRTISLSRRPL